MLHSLPPVTRLALVTCLTNRTLWVWCSGNSEPRSEEALQLLPESLGRLLFGPSCHTVRSPSHVERPRVDALVDSPSSAPSYGRAPSWTPRPVEPSDDSSLSCSVTGTSQGTPSKNHQLGPVNPRNCERLFSAITLSFGAICSCCNREHQQTMSTSPQKQGFCPYHSRSLVWAQALIRTKCSLNIPCVNKWNPSKFHRSPWDRIDLLARGNQETYIFTKMEISFFFSKQAVSWNIVGLEREFSYH